eukprot:4772022-Pleurochrysis_carterae.AAC.1
MVNSSIYDKQVSRLVSLCTKRRAAASLCSHVAFMSVMKVSNIDETGLNNHPIFWRWTFLPSSPMLALDELLSKQLKDHRRASE